MNRYGIIIYWSNTDQAFVAEVPELPGCVHTARHRRPLKNMNEATRLWIDTARGFGDPVPEPTGERLARA